MSILLQALNAMVVLLQPMLLRPLSLKLSGRTRAYLPADAEKREGLKNELHILFPHSVGIQVVYPQHKFLPVTSREILGEPKGKKVALVQITTRCWSQSYHPAKVNEKYLRNKKPSIRSLQMQEQTLEVFPLRMFHSAGMVHRLLQVPKQANFPPALDGRCPDSGSKQLATQVLTAREGEQG